MLIVLLVVPYLVEVYNESGGKPESGNPGNRERENGKRGKSSARKMNANEDASYGIWYSDAWAIIFGCSTGLASMLLILVANTAQPLLRQPPGRFVRARTSFTFLNSSALLAYSIWVLMDRTEATGADDSSACCHGKASCLVIVATISDTLETGSILWQLVMAVDILMIVRDPFQPHRHLSMSETPSSPPSQCSQTPRDARMQGCTTRTRIRTRTRTCKCMETNRTHSRK